jgi:ferritin-like metal-binding protein YciE
MAKIDSLQTLLVEQLRDLYDAEQRLTKAIPKMAKAATNEDLMQALQGHLAETQEHVSRLEEVFETVGETARARPCAGMRGILEEGDEHVNEEFEDDGLRDATIIGAAQRVEHYEIAAYGTAAAHARMLGLDSVVESLEQTLKEEKVADARLTEIAESVVNRDAASADQDEDETDEESASTRRMSGSRGTSVSGGNDRESPAQKNAKMAKVNERGRSAARPASSSEKGRGAARARH